MELPLLVRYRGLIASPEVRATLQEQVERLERFRPKIASCRVSVERWDQHHRQGVSYRVAVDVSLPDEDEAAVEVACESELGVGLDALPAVMRESFDSVENALLRTLRQ